MTEVSTGQATFFVRLQEEHLPVQKTRMEGVRSTRVLKDFFSFAETEPLSAVGLALVARLAVLICMHCTVPVRHTDVKNMYDVTVPVSNIAVSTKR